jgi:MIP family channel proteins
MAENLWKALLVEFLGTFTLVFLGASAAAITFADGGSILASAFAFGLALLAIIYIWGPYSGAHVNPAVSFGFAVAGQMNWGLMLGYWIAQILGAIAAAALVAYFFGTASGAGNASGTLTAAEAGKAVLVEAFLTFFLVLAYLFVYRDPFKALVSGLVIGFTLVACILAGSFLTGASMNPARSLGTGLFSNTMGSYWIYIVGPLLGALVAALVYKLFTVEFGCCDAKDECGKRLKDECGNCLKICKRAIVDNCGRPVLDDCGKQVYEEYMTTERKYGFMQETILGEIGHKMSEHGMSPKYLKQEMMMPKDEVIIEKTVTETPEGVVEKTVTTEVLPAPSLSLRPRSRRLSLSGVTPTDMANNSRAELTPRSAAQIRQTVRSQMLEDELVGDAVSARAEEFASAAARASRGTFAAPMLQ